MIGDARAAGKRGNTYAAGPEYKKKNGEGRSFKHVAGRGKGEGGSEGGGAKETEKVAKRAHRTGPRPGTNTSDKQKPHKQREHKEVRHVDQGQILNEWCSGKRGSYK
jgi:hypothetical protein